MAGPAGNVDLVIAELRIDVGDQLNHLSRLHLRRLGVERAVLLVAEVAAPLAFDAQSDRKGLHLSHQVLRRQNFEILGGTLAPALTLGAQRSLRNHEGPKDGHRG